MKVASYSFFRDAASAYESERCGASRGIFFVNYVRAIVRAHHSVYDDWQLRIHHDDRVMEFPYWKAMERMEQAGLMCLIPMGPSASLCSSMAWRLRPIWDEAVSHVICRDIDSLPTPREAKAVERWANSGHAIHSIHDSISHTGLMGGTIAFNTNRVKATIPRPPEYMPVHGDDQRWLNSYVEPLYRSDTLYDNTASMGPREDPRDMWCNGVGLAFHVDPYVKFLDENPHYCPKLSVIKDCEGK